MRLFTVHVAGFGPSFACVMHSGLIFIASCLSIKKTTELNARAISEHKESQKEVLGKLDRNNERLAKIEEALVFLRETLKK